MTDRVVLTLNGSAPVGHKFQSPLASFELRKEYGGLSQPMFVDVDYTNNGGFIVLLIAIPSFAKVLLLRSVNDIDNNDDIVTATREQPMGFIPRGDEFTHRGKKLKNQVRHGKPIEDLFRGTTQDTPPNSKGAVYRVSEVGQNTWDDGDDTIKENWESSIGAFAKGAVNFNQGVETKDFIEAVDDVRLKGKDPVVSTQRNTRPLSYGLGYYRQQEESVNVVSIRRTFPLVNGYVPYVYIKLDKSIRVRRDGEYLNTDILQPFDYVDDVNAQNYVIGSTLAIDIGLTLQLWVLEGDYSSYTIDTDPITNIKTITKDNVEFKSLSWSLERSFAKISIPAEYETQTIAVSIYSSGGLYSARLSNVLRLYNTRVDKWNIGSVSYSNKFKTSSVPDVFVFYTSLAKIT